MSYVETFVACLMFLSLACVMYSFLACVVQFFSLSYAQLCVVFCMCCVEFLACVMYSFLACVMCSF